jgi:hypothetical protein
MKKFVILALLAGGLVYCLKNGGELPFFDTSFFTQNKKVSKASKAVTVQLEKTAGTVLGTASQVIYKYASNSAETLKSVIIKNSVEKAVEEIKKLPTSDQEEIRKTICK